MLECGSETMIHIKSPALILTNRSTYFSNTKMRRPQKSYLKVRDGRVRQMTYIVIGPFCTEWPDVEPLHTVSDSHHSTAVNNNFTKFLSVKQQIVHHSEPKKQLRISAFN